MTDAPKRLRILQREDGEIFTWTKQLAEGRPNLRPGWLYPPDENGGRRVELDAVSSHVLTTANISQRERALIEENARLQKLLAQQQGLPVTAAPEIKDTPMEPGEMPLPEPPLVEETPILGSNDFQRVPPSVVARWSAAKLVKEITARGGGGEIADPEDLPGLREHFGRLQDAATDGQ